MKDFHVHSGFLKHTKNDLTTVVKTLEELNFSEVLIVEHFTYPVAIRSDIVRDGERNETLYIERGDIPDHVKSVSLGDYVEALDRAQKDTSVKILKGLEVDYFYEYEDEIAALLNKHNFDLLLGSCHFVKERGQYAHLGLNAALKEILGSGRAGTAYYESFFGATQKMVSSKLFDYVAHIDFIKKMIPVCDYDSRLAKRMMIPILESMVKNDVGLEINLKGLEDVSAPYPSEDVVGIYRNLGGRKISIGSDSHSINGLRRSAIHLKRFGEKYEF